VGEEEAAGAVVVLGRPRCHAALAEQRLLLVVGAARDRHAAGKAGHAARAHELAARDGYHEIFNDPMREQAVRDLVGWLDAVLVV
jgi:hypothetical protein